MNWKREIIYFNEVTDFIICSILYINICIYKFLAKMVQKMDLIYPYSDRYQKKKNNNSM